MKKPILYIDMDGVIADFKKEVINTSSITHEDFCNGGFSCENLVDQHCEQYPNIFYNLPPIENAIDSVMQLFNTFDIYFLSTPMYNVPQSYTDKRLWLEKHFGEKAKKRLILTHRKDLCIGDILIDDRLVNGVSEFKGLFIHFGTEKFPNWFSIISRLQQYIYNYEFIIDKDIETLPITNRLLNVLKYSNIKTLKDLSRLTKKDFQQLRNSGKKTEMEAIQILGGFGLAFREN